MTMEDQNASSLPFPYSIKRHGVTITNCHAEPVQTPGCVQSHGVLLVLRRDELIILQVSENSDRLIGHKPETLLGKSIADLIGEEYAAQIAQFLDEHQTERNPLYIFTLTLSNARSQIPLDVTVHMADGVVLLEMERTGRLQAQELDYYAMVKRSTARLQAAQTLEEFCQAVADEVRGVTGLDRVMIYRFLDDGSGDVLAEARREDLHAWKGLRYPPDDIPRPAREIFKKIGVRPLPDAQAAPCEMVPLLNPDTGRPVDMTYCALRGASIMYTEYLNNMGVAASLTMPILRDGELWGLIACHHYTPREFPYQVRAAAEFLAQIASLQLKNAEEREQLQYRNRIDAAHHMLLARAAKENDLASIATGSPGILDGINAGGVALYSHDRWHVAGRTPEVPQLDQLAQWLRAQPEMNHPPRPVVATDALSVKFAPASAYTQIASGILAVPLSRDLQNIMIWFRPEQVQTFNWGGNPYEKPTVVGPNGPRLTPRRSFDLWQELVRGRSAPWRPVEVESALKFRYLVMDLVVSRAEQLETLNRELARSNEELDAFAYVASHDLKEPLRAIQKYAYYLKEEAQNNQALSDAAKERLDGLLRLTLRMDGLLDALLHFSRMGRLQLDYEVTPVDTIVQESIEMLGARVEETRAEIRLPRPMPEVRCDRVRVREVFTNLISNAIKYNNKPDKWVEVGYIDPGEDPPTSFRHELAPAGSMDDRIFYVRDNGIGIDRRHHEQVFRLFKRLHPRDAFGGGSGAGLTIVKKLISQLRGQIWIDSTPGEGTTFFFTFKCDVAMQHQGAGHE